MRYIINNYLIYNSADGTLTLSGSDTPNTQLSLTANALFLFLIQHTGIICREELLKKIWDDNGLTSSNSNLNQYLSMLRKTFRYYGIENIIVAVSRGHLQLNPDITVGIPQEEPATECFSLPPQVPALPEEARLAPQIALHQRGTRWYQAGYALLTASLLAAIVTWIIVPEASPVALTPLMYNECNLLTNKQMLGSVTEDTYGKKFDAVRSHLKLNCLPTHRFAFYYGDKLPTNGLGRVYLAHCMMNEDDPFSYCNNYFYYSWDL